MSRALQFEQNFKKELRVHGKRKIQGNQMAHSELLSDGLIHRNQFPKTDILP